MAVNPDFWITGSKKEFLFNKEIPQVNDTAFKVILFIIFLYICPRFPASITVTINFPWSIINNSMFQLLDSTFSYPAIFWYLHHREISYRCYNSLRSAIGNFICINFCFLLEDNLIHQASPHSFYIPPESILPLFPDLYYSDILHKADNTHHLNLHPQ